MLASTVPLLVGLLATTAPDRTELERESWQARRSDSERRSLLELAAQTGLNVPHSRNGVAGPGPSAGAVLLLRPFAGLALGAGVETARLAWPEGSLQATTTSFRLRIYGALSTPTDVYGELLIGQTHAVADRTSGDNGALGLAVAVERYVASWLRVGGTVGYTLGIGAQSGTAPPAGAGVEHDAHSVSPGLVLRASATFGAGG